LQILRINGCIAIGKPERQVRRVHPVTAINNRDQSTICLFAPHARYITFFVHIPFVVNRAFSATSTARL